MPFRALHSPEPGPSPTQEGGLGRRSGFQVILGDGGTWPRAALSSRSQGSGGGRGLTLLQRKALLVLVHPLQSRQTFCGT